jgi:malic enzyme
MTTATTMHPLSSNDGVERGEPGRRTSSLDAPRGQIATALRGRNLIANPLMNKGTSFSLSERDAFSLHGLLPSRVATIEQQVSLELEHVRRKGDDLERYIGLAALQDRNETLFYRVLTEHLEEFLPVVYTPTVGRACEQFSHIFRRPRGVWITPADVGRIDEILRVAGEDIRLIVVTDNERILGLGDQGAGGMAIPVGKLALYSAAAGIYPARTLPISLDVGTDRAELLEDPLYVGYRAPRLRGAAYDRIIEAFVESVRRVFPATVLQWEDFKQHNALRILAQYRHRLPSFNDDIQGTGAVVLGGLLAARGDQGLADERFLFVGAGAAAIGIARLIATQLRTEGLLPDAVCARMCMMDHRGLIYRGREHVADDQLPFAVDPARFAAAGLAEPQLSDPVAIARVVEASVLIGTTGGCASFSPALVGEVASHSPLPIVLPLSNPTECSEARPEDVLEWTGGRAIVATGSPSRAVELLGGQRLIGQANNVFIFPAMGLAAIVAEARVLTDEAFVVAARELAAAVRPERLNSGAIYPAVSELRVVTRQIAIALVRHLRDTGYGRRLLDEEIEPAVERAMWRPEYLPYVAA